MGSYILVAADDRETFYGDDGVVTVRSGMEKVRTLPVGIGTGAGLTLPVFGALDDLATKPAHLLVDTGDVGQYFNEFMQAFQSTASQHVTGPGAAMLGLANWVIASISGGQVRLHRYHSARGYSPELFNPGVPTCILPLGVTAENSMPHELSLMRSLVPSRGARDFQRTLPTNMVAFARFFAAIDLYAHCLGDGIQFGVLFSDGQTEVLPVEPLDSFLRKPRDDTPSGR